MKLKRSTIVLVLSFAFLLACQFLTQPFSSVDDPVASETPTLLALEPSPTPDDPSVPLAGLIYGVFNSETYSNAVWQIGEDGVARLLLPNHYFGMLSPDGSQVVYYDFQWGYRETPPCIWIEDVTTGEAKSLICSSGMEGDLLPSILGWHPTRPDTVLAILDQTGGGMGGSQGYFGTISLIDGSTNILDPNHPIKNGEAEVSPDGKMIAYGSGIYFLDSGYQEFDPSIYGIDKAFHAENPSWSSDGKKIAWGLVTDNGTDPVQVSLGVFDLEQKTAMLLLPTFTPGRAGEALETVVPYSVWSPDGQWLAVNIKIDLNDPSNANIQDGWKIVSADGQTLHELDGEFDAWSPDGQWVTHINWDKDGDGLALFVARADGSETHSLGEVRDYYNAVRWSRDGRYLVFAGLEQTIHYVKTGDWQVHEFALENLDATAEISLFDWIVPLNPWIQ